MIARQVAQQYWGEAIRPATSRDQWSTEGLSEAFVKPALIDVTDVAVPDEEIFAPFLSVQRVHNHPVAGPVAKRLAGISKESLAARRYTQAEMVSLRPARLSLADGDALPPALLNAIAHRDYRHAGNVFVRQYPRRLEVVSPGGFPPGISTDNLLWRQQPRNRRIADTLQKCGLVERAGQGMNRMFEESIKQGKATPDFTGTDGHQVFLTLRGEVQDPIFLRFLEKVGNERMKSFTTDDLVILDLVRRDAPVPAVLRQRLPALLELGVIERVGTGRGARHFLSRDLYRAIEAKGTYTRKRGLDRETQKALLLKHVVDSGGEGAPFGELAQVLPELSARSVQRLMHELRRDGKVLSTGRTRATRWRGVP